MCNSIKDPAFLIKEAVVVACNQNAVKLFRQNSEKLIGQPIFNHFPEKQPDGFNSVDTLLFGMGSMTPGKVAFFDWTHWDKNRLPFNSQVSLTGLMIKNELVFQYIIRDASDSITDIKINQSLLELADSSSDLMLITDKEGKIEWVNTSFTDISGYSFVEVYKKDLLALLKNSDTPAKTISSISKGLEKGKSVKAAEIVNFAKGGGTFGMLLDIKPVKNCHGKVDNQIWVGYNITKKKPVAKEKSNSQQRFKDLVRQSPVGIFLYEINYLHELVLIESNQAANDILGLNTFDLIGLTIEKAFPGLVNTELPKLYMETARSGKPLQLGDVRYDEGGIHGDFQVNAFQAGQNHVAVTFLDITKRKKAENEIIKKNEELTKLNEELDHFVYSASHDLRAPIASLLGVTKLLRLENEPERIDKLLDLQEKSLVRLDYFISDIVTYSKNSRLNLNREIINFQDELNGIFDELHFMNKVEFITKEIEIEQETKFCSDPRRIRVILNNLITNAIKYSDITKNQPHLKIHISIKPDKAIISVKDNGIGIEPTLQNKIFDMFFRGTEASKGSGLGLYIVSEVVKKMEGTIAVTSSVGKGSCFTVKLPQLI